MRLFISFVFLLCACFSALGAEKELRYLVELQDGSRFQASLKEMGEDGSLLLSAENVNDSIRIAAEKIKTLERMGPLTAPTSLGNSWMVELNNGSLLRGEVRAWDSERLELLWQEQELALDLAQVIEVSRRAPRLPAAAIDTERWKVAEGLIFQGGCAFFSQQEQSINFENLPSQGSVSLGWLPALSKAGLIIEMSVKSEAGKKVKVKVLVGDKNLVSKDINGNSQTLQLNQTPAEKSFSLSSEQELKLVWDLGQGFALAQYRGEQFDFPLPQQLGDQENWNLQLMAARGGQFPLFTLSSLSLNNLEKAPISGSNQAMANDDFGKVGLHLRQGGFWDNALITGIEPAGLDDGVDDSSRNLRVKTPTGELLVDVELFSSLVLSKPAAQAAGQQQPSWVLRFEDGQSFHAQSVRFETNRVLFSLPALGELGLPLDQLISLESL